MALSSHREHRPRSRSPPRKPARSPSPPRRDRQRSRSPRRRHDDRPRKSGGGFRWKEKPRYEDERERRDERRLERGYREQERERRPSDRRDGDVERKFGRGNDIEDKFGKRDDDAPDREDQLRDNTRDRPRKEKKPAAAAAPAPMGEPMITVNVNDRLGTKTSIPCMASDTISMSLSRHPTLPASDHIRSLGKGAVADNCMWVCIEQFKMFVAASIGRQPHEIMLKRQGERPFKDQLTLEDYGVSNGVQLDLYVLLRFWGVWLADCVLGRLIRGIEGMVWVLLLAFGLIAEV